MPGLVIVLVAKIALTIGAWCIPLLLFPVNLLQALGFPAPDPVLFLRLLGMAYGALVLGYAFGLRSARRGEYPSGPVWVGILSNGGACAVLLVSAVQGAWAGWGTFAQFFMWTSLLGTGAITAGLVAFGPCRSRAGVPGGTPGSQGASR